MVPEKAERLEHEDMVALPLLVRSLNLLPDVCVSVCAQVRVC